MRVTNRASTRNYLRYMNTALSNQQRTNERLHSGNRFERISEDVSSGIRAMTAKTELYKTEKHLSNVQSLNETLTAAENSMQTIHDQLKTVNEKLLKAINGDEDPKSRKVYASEIRALRDEIYQLGNSKYSDQFLFSGSNNYMAPFQVDDSTGDLLYNGIPVDEIQLDTTDNKYYYMDNGVKTEVPLNDEIYMDVGLGITMSGSDIDPSTAFNISYAGPEILGFGVNEDTGFSNNLYNLLTDIANELEQESLDQKKVDELQVHLSDRMDSFLTNITDIGAKTTFLTNMENRLQVSADNLEIRIANLTGTDYIEESTHQASQVVITQALYKMGSSVIPMSLMNFIN